MTPETSPPLTAPEPLARPTSDERIMAALSHLGILLPLTGLLLPTLIWLTQKDKSAFVRFQAAQAVALHLAQIVFYFAGGGCYFCSAVATFLFVPLMAGVTTSDSAAPLIVLPIFLPIIMVLLVLVLGLVFLVAGLAAAILTFQGKDVHIPILGVRVEKYLAS